jgi:hypothetical protein
LVQVTGRTHNEMGQAQWQSEATVWFYTGLMYCLKDRDAPCHAIHQKFMTCSKLPWNVPRLSLVQYILLAAAGGLLAYS